MDDLPPDLARDVLEEHLAQRFGVEVADVFAEEGGAGEEEAAAADDVTDDGDRGSSCDEVEMIAARSEVEAAPALPTLDAVCKAAVISSMGFVTSLAGPWASIPIIGRLTDWPKKNPIPLRNCTMKCYLHPGCTTPAMKRYNVDNDQLLRWLFLGEIPAKDATPAAKKVLTQAHKALWVSQFVVGAATASSSGATLSGYVAATATFP